jgi:hypothetical protein
MRGRDKRRGREGKNETREGENEARPASEGPMPYQIELFSVWLFSSGLKGSFPSKSFFIRTFMPPPPSPRQYTCTLDSTPQKISATRSDSKRGGRNRKQKLGSTTHFVNYQEFIQVNENKFIQVNEITLLDPSRLHGQTTSRSTLHP